MVHRVWCIGKKNFSIGAEIDSLLQIVILSKA